MCEKINNLFLRFGKFAFFVGTILVLFSLKTFLAAHVTIVILPWILEYWMEYWILNIIILPLNPLRIHYIHNKKIIRTKRLSKALLSTYILFFSFLFSHQRKVATEPIFSRETIRCWCCWGWNSNNSMWSCKQERPCSMDQRWLNVR